MLSYFASVVPDTPLAAWGIPGFIIVVLGLVVVFMYRENKALQEKLVAAYQARLDDAKARDDKKDDLIELAGDSIALLKDKLVVAKKGARR